MNITINRIAPRYEQNRCGEGFYTPVSYEWSIDADESAVTTGELGEVVSMLEGMIGLLTRFNLTVAAGEEQ